MGRIILRIKDGQIEGKTIPLAEGFREEEVYEAKCGGIGGFCRICYSEKSSPENPLLSTCNCTGTLKFTHYKCLKTWLNYRLVIKKQEQLISFHWKSFECEICKSPYPPFIKLNKTTYELDRVEVEKRASYIRIEVMSKIKGYAREVYLLFPSEGKTIFKLGRGHESDIKLADISVSRTHAVIIATPEGYILEDNASKFGTLLLLQREEHEIDANDGLSVQMGRSIMKIFAGERDDMEDARGSQEVEEEKYIAGAEAYNGDNDYTDSISGDDVRTKKTLKAEAKGAPKRDNNGV
eukprot:TRINITY_DN6547_c0_g1_i23.p1 TRINITY_DN6547_c0_g1~~TRINITY_DN6547_c0_g1_i23.p1  ORF type:complete len:294 (-),score=76.60 TRINITY_DN6547_c0_g1_i23:126-1007(-)